MIKFALPFLSLAVLLPAAASASSYSTAIDRLEASNPEFVFHADLNGDFDAAGAFLTEAYMAYLMTGPDIPPIPVDYTRLFNHLGLSNMTSLTAVSEPRETGGFINQTLFRFSEPPKGLFLLLGDHNQPFTVQHSAPADADLVMEMNLNGIALFGIVRNIIIDIMGPMGQGMIESQMNKPVTEGGPTLADIINRFTTRMQIIAKPEFDSDSAQSPALAFLNGKTALRIANVADLLETFTPTLQKAGFTPLEDPKGTVWSLEIPNELTDIALYIQALSGTNDLLLSFSRDTRQWLTEGDAHIDGDANFIRDSAGLPTEGLSFWYTTKEMADLQIQNLDAELPADSPYAPVIQSFKAFLMRYSGPQAGVSLMEDDAYRVISFQPTSYKTNLALAAVIVPISIAAAMPPETPEETDPLAPEEDESAPAASPPE